MTRNNSLEEIPIERLRCGRTNGVGPQLEQAVISKNSRDRDTVIAEGPMKRLLPSPKIPLGSRDSNKMFFPAVGLGV
jgi:hypothetical protein